jgi:predicted Zn-dependent protease
MPVGASGRRLIAPEEVVLYVQSELKSRDFIEPLVCDLERVLVAPVRVKVFDLTLGPELRATPTQFDGPKVAQRMIQATATDGGGRAFKYLLVPDDLKMEPWRFVFSLTFGNETVPYHGGVLSTKRLDVADPRTAHHRGAEITATRAYKLILKSIARAAGYAAPERCILAFPRSLEELDLKSSEFCPEDRAQLVAAGILKASEDGGCLPIS